MHTMFGTKHLIILAILVLFSAGAMIASRKWTLAKFTRIMLFIGIVSEIIKVFYYTLANEETLGGILPKPDLPFHLCSIQIIFFMVIHFLKNEKVSRFLYSFMLPSCILGGLAAILIPTESSLNGHWILTVQFFGYHACVVCFGMQLARSDEFKLQVSDYVNCLKLLLVIMFFAMYMNSALYAHDPVTGELIETNFMYISSPPVTGLPYLNENHGWFVYFCHYAGLVILCVTVTYIKPLLRAIFRKKSPATAE